MANQGSGNQSQGYGRSSYEQGYGDQPQSPGGPDYRSSGSSSAYQLPHGVAMPGLGYGQTQSPGGSAQSGYNQGYGMQQGYGTGQGGECLHKSPAFRWLNGHRLQRTADLVTRLSLLGSPHRIHVVGLLQRMIGPC